MDSVCLAEKREIMGNGISIGESGAALNDDKMLFHAVTRKKERESQNDSRMRGNSIYVGDLVNRQEMVSDKFAQAQKSAIKRLMDQFKADLAIDEGVEESENLIGELEKNTLDAHEHIKGVDERRNEIRKRYEIAPDSQEQKDLELVQKANAAIKDPFNKDLALTEEEEKRLREMPPLTDYQKEMLECDKEEEKYRNIIRDNRQNVVVENATIHATEKALLKVHPMVDAKKDAEAIIKDALQEQAGELLREGVNKVDEDVEEAQKEQFEAQEKELEEKIRREKMKEEEAEREKSNQELRETVFAATTQLASGSQQAILNLQTDIKALIQDQIVLDVDMKGLRVNEQV